MNRLKELRVSIGKSQSALATDLHIAQNTVSQWENESRSIDSDKLHILADYFQVSTDYLLGRSDDPTPPNEKSPIYDDEAWELMKDMYERPELRALFKTSKNVKPEDIKVVDELLKRMAGNTDDV